MSGVLTSSQLRMLTARVDGWFFSEVLRIADWTLPYHQSDRLHVPGFAQHQVDGGFVPTEELC